MSPNEGLLGRMRFLARLPIASLLTRQMQDTSGCVPTGNFRASRNMLREWCDPNSGEGQVATNLVGPLSIMVDLLSNALKIVFAAFRQSNDFFQIMLGAILQFANSPVF